MKKNESKGFVRKNESKFFVNKIPTYRCLVCGEKNQTGVCPYCGRISKYVGLEVSFGK